MTKRKLVFTKLYKILIDGLNKKKKGINQFALQLGEIPVYITYCKVDDTISKLTIQDVGEETTRVIIVELNDSITHLLFIFSLIREEYEKNVLFTEKSQL